MSITVTGQRSELGRLVSQESATRRIHVSVAGQEANTLLHDGHAWKDFARKALAGVKQARRVEADMLVHASFAFVLGQPMKDPLRSIVGTIRECEDIALSGPIPACVVRLGYLYGPQSRDLLAYKKAFRLGRPYWAGSRKAAQFHLYQDDAASALIAAAKQKNAGNILYATDGTPLSFMDFMDDFARKMGTRVPLHVPLVAAPMMRLIVCKEHMQQAALPMPIKSVMPGVPGWKPAFVNSRAGLEQVVAEWNA